MIPKIMLINDGDDVDELIVQFAHLNGIEPSHRILVLPEKDELTVEQIHLMKKDIRVAFSKKVLVVLRGVDDSSIEVQNSLLKCLEEETDRIQFLFFVKNSSRLLSTILSRCAMIETKLRFNEASVSEDYSELFSLKNNSEVTKDEAINRIDRFIQNTSLKKQDTLKQILQMRKLIIDNNMNPVLALDHILLFLSRTSTMKVEDEKK